MFPSVTHIQMTMNQNLQRNREEKKLDDVLTIETPDEASTNEPLSSTFKKAKGVQIKMSGCRIKLHKEIFSYYTHTKIG